MDSHFEEQTAESNTLVLHGIPHYSSVSDVKKDCEKQGIVLFVKLYTSLHRAYVVYSTVEEAIKAKQHYELINHKAVFGRPVTEQTILSYQLLPPVNTQNYLTSPPASPPPEWEPIYEFVNRVPSEDCRPVIEGAITTLLRNADNLTPTIILDRCDDSD
eukprot:TRINITY_DN11892_c0_g1_i1.p1 TRINITY_DN11892_c0_g1~~TRINITY_DN11892_c0_g1_i1.p1  ORF type:complete len:159 (+),score=15.28 TRINITY_DN11892_c0_g1_i1:47-523(+)